jgi:hypothetical protein
MKKILIILSITFILSSCDFNLPTIDNSYEEKLTVFSNVEIQAFDNNNIMSIDIIHVSLTSGIEQDVQKDSLYINNANLLMTYTSINDDNINIENCTVTDSVQCFRYNSILKGYEFVGNAQTPHLGDSLFLEVSYSDYKVNAYTLIPENMDISSTDITPYNCNGEAIDVKAIKTDNFNIIFEELSTFFIDKGIITLDEIENINLLDIINNLDSLNYIKYTDFIIKKIEESSLSKIELKDNGECYIGSFASYPYFRINFERSMNINTSINIINYALEANRIKYIYEPMGEDINCNEIYSEGDSTGFYENLFYDYGCQSESGIDIFKLWKNEYTFDTESRLRFTNPFVWLADTSPIPMMWLYFNYYGLQLITVQSVDQAYYDYFTGDPFVFNSQQNQFILPDSNIENGYGLFSSSLSKSFFIYADRY